MTDKLEPVAAPAAIMQEEIIEYDDSRVLRSIDLMATAPAIVTGGAWTSFQDTSDGSRYEASFSTYGIPGVTPFGVGPRAGAGGLSLGLFAVTDKLDNLDNLKNFDLDPALAPQVGAGGVNYTYGAGVCAGFWCAGTEGLAPIPPAAMLIISGIEAIKSSFGVELEDAEMVPAVMASRIVSNFIPVKQVIGTLSLLGVRTGMGPEPERFKTIAAHFNFRNEIEELLELNARQDALKKLDLAIDLQRDPYVKADLMDMKDHVLFEKHEKDIPSTDSIERHIREVIEDVEAFRVEYSEWLSNGRGRAPEGRDIEEYMANSLYLGRKLRFRVEKITEDGKIKLKIRESAPFQINDPSLAARFVETVAGIYRALGSKSSGLVQYVASKTELTVSNLVESVDELKYRPQDPSPAVAVLEAEAARAWHMQWTDSMGSLYANFHRRRDHMKWVVKKNAKSGDRERLVKQISAVALPWPENLRANFIRMAGCKRELARRHMAIKPGIDVLIAAANIEREDFPGDLGDGSLFLYESKLKKWSWRPQMVDAFYMFGNLYRAISADRENSKKLKKLAWASAQRLMGVMRRNVPEVRREWHSFTGSPDGFFDTHSKDWLLRRIDDLRDELDDIDASGLKEFADGKVTDKDSRESLKSAIENFKDGAKKAKAAMDVLAKDAKKFLTDWNRMGSFDKLSAIEKSELERIGAAIGAWREFAALYEKLIYEVENAATSDAKKRDESAKKLREGMASMSALVSKIIRNHARLNIKRTGAAYMESYLTMAGIDPAIPQNGRVF